MPHTVVIADDVTGANDIGIMYTKAGHSSVVYSLDQLDERAEFEEDVSIIDTNSRFLSDRDAFRRVCQAVMLFPKNQVRQFFNKQCSVFRGNIGAEFDAMLDALEEEFAIIILGFPDNGRTTIHGIHYVHGKKLEDSQFKDDPVHPMKQSDLLEILKSQTGRKAAAIHYEYLDQGVEILKQRIGELKEEVNYVIIDVRNNEDLSVIAEAVRDEKVICGSSAIGYYLGLLHKSNAKQEGTEALKRAGTSILCIAGSLTPQTKSQIAYIKNRNYPVITLDTTQLFTGEAYRNEKRRILKEYAKARVHSPMVLIHSMNQEEEVLRTKHLAAAAGIDNTAVSEMVSAALSDLAKVIADHYKIRKFVICGGDTSASFCNKMSIKGMKVIKEIESGLPTCRSITKPYYELVLKSGSFGSEEFIEKAKDILLCRNLHFRHDE
ncbi:MAG TPA: four-carbon acid sugar kinase family protein [Clostridiales bacterium]|nr:four-carbon acid sugar kinase family protein [Clostridiales bacterium]